MKNAILNLVRFQIIITGLFLLISIPFHSCEPDEDEDEDEVEDENESDSLAPVRKPNIYLYPAERSRISVNLIFPIGGKIITSIPTYGNGWMVDVDTSGIINNKYEYLFYESVQPEVWQLTKGWVIKKSELKSFFTDNLFKYGFNSKEINDFIDYWIPRLIDSEYYEIYPQESSIIDIVIKLDISKTPDNILRLFYLIKGTNNPSNSKISTPSLYSHFNRNGFNVTEWGVILK